MNDNKTAERLHLCRKERRETLDQVAALIGVNKSTVSRWEQGNTTRLNLATLQVLAKHYGVSVEWLSGEDVPRYNARNWLEDHSLPLDELIDLPVWGTAPGKVVRQPAFPDAPWEYNEFWLIVEGDSMAPQICADDLILVRAQETAQDGQYAVVLIDSAKSVVRRVRLGKDYIELQCDNPYYPPQRFEGEDRNRVRIVGIVIESKRKYL